MDNLSPQWQLDLLLDRVPAIVAKYGDIAAEAAVEWYMEQRGMHVADDAFEALAAQPLGTAYVQQAINSQSSSLWDSPEQMGDFLTGAIGRWVHYSGRQTITNNVIRDPSKPRWARVPRGAKTCSFCMTCASQGFVYLSEKTALYEHGDVGSKYHKKCDCEAVASWDAEESVISGYDPDRLYGRYATARDMIMNESIPDEWREQMKSHGIPTDSMYNMNALAFLTRRLYPDSVTDGVKQAA